MDLVQEWLAKVSAFNKFNFAFTAQLKIFHISWFCLLRIVNIFIVTIFIFGLELIGYIESGVEAPKAAIDHLVFKPFVTDRKEEEADAHWVDGDVEDSYVVKHCVNDLQSRLVKHYVALI